MTPFSPCTRQRLWMNPGRVAATITGKIRAEQNLAR
jgi:hypothetical protein